MASSFRRDDIGCRAYRWDMVAGLRVSGDKRQYDANGRKRKYQDIQYLRHPHQLTGAEGSQHQIDDDRG